MRALSFIAACVLWSNTAQAAVTDEAFLRAAVVVMIFDRLAADCRKRGGFSNADARKAAAWQSDNSIDTLRSRLPELDREPAHKRRIEQGVQAIVDQLAGKGVSPCDGAMTAIRLPESQLAKTSPQLLAGGKPSAAAAPDKKAAASTAPRDSAQALLKQIDSFGFDSRMAMGAGGFLTTDIYPVVLFRNGEVLTDAKGLAFPGGIAAHKRAHPNRWTQWRRAGRAIELNGSKGWKALPFRATYASLPPGFVLEGRFQSLGGTGNVGVGGTDSVTVWRDYRFSRDGRVVRGGGAGSRAEGGNSSVVTSNIAPNRRGRYQIDGLALNITYDDGSSERRILITDPQKPTVIWLDGVGYTQ